MRILIALFMLALLSGCYDINERPGLIMTFETLHTGGNTMLSQTNTATGEIRLCTTNPSRITGSEEAAKVVLMLNCTDWSTSKVTWK